MTKLFEIKFVTKDTRLGTALVALEGIAYGKPEITPIRGAKVTKRGKVRADNGAGTLRARLAEAIRNYPHPEIARQAVTTLLIEVGGHKTSTSSFVDAMMKTGVLKQKGKANYRIIKE